MKNFYNYIFGFAVVFGIIPGTMVSCDQPEALASNPASKGRQLHKKVSVEQNGMPLIITYHLDSITSSEEAENIYLRSKDEQEIIFALNRIDPNRTIAGSALIIPDTVTADFLDYSPLPRTFEMLNKIPKVVLISRRVQAFGLYEEGRLLKWGPVSTGKEATPTPAGLFYGNYKARRKVSTVNASWIMPYYFNFMNFHGVGVHQYAMPGYPASHACVRLYMEDAKMIYDWADQWKLDSRGREILQNGTPFMVFGDYDFDKPVPWLSLAENHNSNFLTAGEMETLRSYVNSYFKDKRNFEIPVFPGEILSLPPQEGLETLR